MIMIPLYGDNACMMQNSFIDSLVLGISCSNFQLIIENISLEKRREIIFRWMPYDFINEEPTLAQLMAWCR